MTRERNFVSLFVTVAALLLFTATAPVYGAVVDLPDGSKADLSSICPVCGMKVEAGTVGTAALVLNDGSVKVFDGPGDLFRFVLSPATYGFSSGNLKHAFVTDYTDKKFIEAKKAYYVVGSNLSGGMGPEAVPFATREAAEKFRIEHQGKAVLSYEEVTLEHLKPRKKILKMDQGAPGGSRHSH